MTEGKNNCIEESEEKGSPVQETMESKNVPNLNTRSKDKCITLAICLIVTVSFSSEVYGQLPLVTTFMKNKY